MMGEIWKDIPSWRGYYQASDLGNIRSLNRYTQGNNSKRHIKGRVLKQRLNKGDGGLYVNLSVNSKQRVLQVHRLIAEAFYGPCPEGMECCHNDGDHINNKLNNLRWDTKANNELDKEKHGTRCRGDNHPTSKLTDDNVRLIKILSKRGNITQKQIAKLFNVSLGHVNDICVGEKRRDVLPYGWKENRKVRKQRKLTVEEVKQIKRLIKEGELSQIKIGEMFNLDSSAVCRIKAGKTWKHVTIDEE